MSIRKFISRSLKILAVGIVLLFGAALVYLHANRHRIGDLIKQRANQSMNATLDFDRIQISLRHFPSFGLTIKDLSVAGKGDFTGDTLVTSKSLNVSLDLFSVLKKSTPVRITYIGIENSDVHLVVDSAGRSNYDIFETGEKEGDTTSSNLSLQLKEVVITGSAFTYEDRPARQIVGVDEISYRGRGNFSADRFDLVSDLSSRLSVEQSGISYLNNARVQSENTLQVDMTEGLYQLSDNTLKINDLSLLLEGNVQRERETYRYDISFSSPSNAFSELLSLIPEAYTDDFDQIDSQGEFETSGWIRSTTDSFPKFEVLVSAQNGAFTYPELPLGFDNIELDGNISSPGHDPDRLVTQVNKLSWVLAGKPFDARARITTPVSDPYIQGTANGTLDLAALQQAFPLSGVDELAGLLTLNIEGNTSLSAIQTQELSGSGLNGQIRIEDLSYRSGNDPELAIPSGIVSLSENRMNIDQLKVNYGSSDLAVNGWLGMQIIFPGQVRSIPGAISIAGGSLDMNDFNSDADTAGTDSGPRSYPSYLDKLDLVLDASLAYFQYDEYEFEKVNGNGRLTGDRLDIQLINMNHEGGQLAGDGYVNNLWNYLYRDADLLGNLEVTSRDFDLDKLMVVNGDNADATGSPETSVPVIPANLRMDIHATADRLVLQGIPLSGFSTAIDLNDGVLRLSDMVSGFLGGSLNLSGSYDTRDPKQPGINFQYDMTSLAFEEAFRLSSTFAQLAPIAEFMKGRFNTSLRFRSQINDQLLPVLSSINADGVLETLHAEVLNFPPLKRLADSLQLFFLNKLDISRTKNKITIVDGVVYVDPFTVKQGDLSMQIGGYHSLETGMHYQVEIDLPFEMVRDKLGIGKPLEHLKSQADKLGLPLSAGTMAKLVVDMGGTIRNPSFKLGLQRSGDLVTAVEQTIKSKIDSAEKVLQQRRDTLEEQVRERIEKGKTQARERVQRTVDSLRAAAQGRVAVVRQKARELANGIRAEANTRADQLVKEAGNDPVKKLAAETLARKLRDEAEKKASKVETDADNEISRILERAQQRIDSLQTQNVSLD